MENLEEIILASLGRLEVKERISLIDDLIHRLKFERRVALLTPKQLEHMSNHLSVEQKDRINNCKNEKERNEVVHGYARCNYIRELAWANYLNGWTDDPPFAEENVEVNKR